ncbi:hypothetical protein O181_002119 [Austropuccinia psidii MF-1]|uniref:Blue (type 1) copper domain-containing protein n=1 Tax=Austropuccinia psidii MF-1 TaxID=1389203 RepID=A0A9Q3BBR0_9BASI|nr:hypothetical protein [Austropuccinia psidii MF-1]
MHLRFTLPFCTLAMGMVSLLCPQNISSKAEEPKIGNIAPSGSLPRGQNYDIVVGSSKAERIFSPPTVTAKIGDTVTFVFQAKAHSVSQSFFEKPCQLAVGAKGKGFDSGIVSVKTDAKSSELPRWTLQILVDTPIWFYCAAPGHCGSGMVGAINPRVSGEKTFEKFQALAQAQNGSGFGNNVQTVAGRREANLRNGQSTNASRLGALQNSSTTSISSNEHSTENSGTLPLTLKSFIQLAPMTLFLISWAAY